MAKKQDEPQTLDATVATEPPAIENRVTMPKAPAGDFNVASAGLLSRVRATLEQMAYSRDPQAAAAALISIDHMVMPPNINPPVRQYLAEARDYLQGKAKT